MGDLFQTGERNSPQDDDASRSVMGIAIELIRSTANIPAESGYFFFERNKNVEIKVFFVHGCSS